MNAGQLLNFYKQNRMWDTFTYHHEYLGPLTVRFAEPVNIPKAIGNSNGLIQNFGVILIHHNLGSDMTAFPPSHVDGALKLRADGKIHLFELSPLGSGTIFFKSDNPVTWRGNTYESVPCALTGEEFKTEGTPTPKFTIGQEDVDLLAFKGLIDDALARGERGNSTDDPAESTTADFADVQQLSSATVRRCWFLPTNSGTGAQFQARAIQSILRPMHR
ncbi:hypothetical protein G432_05835 [Sphingomonas sp. MM-1]|uniref:hypothetical protein n=1 Tax=Sphingomonas sp. MM-1 TaxID=745310 RepID=UPI0002C0F50E|nr:hypothetical protein [Sphingomonas sp. MM-1]AGH48894.1 hypothetical protein G432_05835 [Sphingomonas sp. MM-1]